MTNTERIHCRLCQHPTVEFSGNEFYNCPNCHCILRLQLPTAEMERERYLTHNNDVRDPGYRTFTSPITNYILKHFTPAHRGLDFGAGTGPVISAVLKENKYDIVPYDPFFENQPEVLSRRYDYIACCEVVEHFHHPDVEFANIRERLNPGGAFVAMTHLYNKTIPFANWYYKNDPTHVIIYTKETLEYLARAHGFSLEVFSERLFVLRKKL